MARKAERAKTPSKKGSPVGEPDRRRRDLEDKRWYADERKPHEAVSAVVNALARTGRRSEMQLWLDLFRDKESGREGARQGVFRPGLRARFNVIRNAIEVLHSRIGRTQPRPWIVTSGADWKLQRKSKSFQRYLEGDMERIGANRLRRRALLDALVFGTGALKVHASQSGQVQWSRVWAGNLLKHPREEAAGGAAVRTLYEIAFVDREVLASQYVDERKIIENLPRPDRSLLRYDGADEHDDLVLVAEAWHLPPRRDDNGEWEGGRHVIVTSECTLEDDDWCRDSFPIAELHATTDPGCERGIGFPERMAGLQSEQNSLSELASDVARKMTPKIVLTKGSKLTVDALSNEIEVWETDGEMPQILSAENVILAVMQAAQLQRSEMYSIEGISEASAEGHAPAHLDSGKAQLVNRDIESERHVDLFLNNEQFTIDLVKCHIATSEELASVDGGAEKLVAYHGKSILTELKWTEVSIANDPYQVRVYPTSQISGSPQAKLAQLNEMIKAGWISPDQARQIYDLPDLDAANDLDFAGRELARKLVEEAIDGHRVAATRACDLPYLVLEGWKEHALSQIQGASEDDLELLRDLLGHAQTLIDQQAAEAAKKAAALAPPQPPTPPAAAMPPSPMGGPPPLQVVP